MIHKSCAAKRFFKNELRNSGDREMDEYSATTLQHDFYDKALATAALATFDDMKAIHSEATANGRVKRAEGISFEALELSGEGKGLIVSRPDGVRDLIVWSAQASVDLATTITELYLIPVRPDIPEEMSKRIATHFADGTATLENILPLATEAADYAQPTLKDIISTLSKDGVSSKCWKVAAASTKLIGGDYGPSVRGASRDYDRNIGMLERLVKTFAWSSVPVPGLREYEVLCRAGHLAHMSGSVSANQFESAVADHVGDILEIAAAARELRLGGGTCLAYNDTDVRVSVEEFEGRVVYRHDNIDRNEQNVFFTVVNMEGDRPISIDVYVANCWSHDFATANGIDEGEEIDIETYEYLIDDIRQSSGKLGEDVLAGKLEAGETPAEGRAYRFDLEARTLEVFTAAERTGYLAYVPHMIERDLEILNAVRAGEEYDLGTEFQIRDVEAGPQADVERVKPEKYLAGLRARSDIFPKP